MFENALCQFDKQFSINFGLTISTKFFHGDSGLFLKFRNDVLSVADWGGHLPALLRARPPTHPRVVFLYYHRKSFLIEQPYKFWACFIATT